MLRRSAIEEERRLLQAAIDAFLAGSISVETLQRTAGRSVPSEQNKLSDSIESETCFLDDFAT